MADVIRALIIEDNRIEALVTQKWLTGNPELALDVEWVDTLAAGLERVARGNLDVIILDLNLPDSTGLETFVTLKRRASGVPIIVLTGEYDESVGILAVQQGAEEYLIKQQLEAPTLPRIVQFAVARHKTQVEQITKQIRNISGRVISFLGSKGGVGTTTVATNVAVSLAEKGHSVILAELRPTFGALASGLQRKPTNSLASLLEIPAHEIGEDDLNAVLCQGPAAIRLLYGTHLRETGPEPEPAHTERIIKIMTRLAEFVILDLASLPTVTAMTAAQLSQFVGVVTERESLSLSCGKSVVAHLKDWGVLNDFIGSIVIGQNSVTVSITTASIRSLLGCGILRMVPPAAEACYEAHVNGTPLVLNEPDHLASDAFRTIARLLTDERGVQFEVA
jgi:MinD-like ATPase involved in chromosome partitioning or flagellar assembly/ActR/RegA family two-component response regulator